MFNRHYLRRAALAWLAALTTIVGCSRATATATREPQLAWGPAPAILPEGAQLAVLDGNPSAAAPFTIRLRFPDGYRIMPHTHPTDEHVTVISGTFRIGMGSTFRSESLTTLTAGGFATAPAHHAHYAAAQGETIVQVNAVGPFALTYVNPADAPKVITGR